MAEITKRPTAVHVVGVDARSKNALILFFQTLGDKSCELVDASYAELFLINRVLSFFFGRLLYGHHAAGCLLKFNWYYTYGPQ